MCTCRSGRPRAFAFAARRGVRYPLLPRQPDDTPSDSGRIPGLVKELKVGCQFKATGGMICATAIVDLATRSPNHRLLDKFLNIAVLKPGCPMKMQSLSSHFAH
ncbi:hypothetical protein DFH06DRAFT_1131302 [Mycena polygramma]|nr:hypothetical protein DFH06DRAFT_1131302 [Mycena polygramma]